MEEIQRNLKEFLEEFLDELLKKSCRNSKIILKWNSTGTSEDSEEELRNDS